MPSYAYQAVTSSGERVGGVLSGASEQAVLAELEARRLMPVRLTEHRENALARRRRIPIRQLATAYLQLADLLRAGVPLLRGLRLLSRRKSAPRLARSFGELADAVADGTELAEAMSARPEAFPAVHVAMVRAGEKGGFLESVLARLGQYLTSQAEMRSKLIGNLIYPAVLVLVGSGVLTLVFGVFVPKFRKLFAALEAKGQLPTLTKVVLDLGALVSHYGLIVLAVLIVAAFAARRIATRPAAQRRLAEWRLRLPVVGPLLRAIAVARFCRVLGTMLANGIPMLAAMQIAKEAAGNPLMQEAVEAATESVRRGEPLAGPLGASGLFPDDVLEMVGVAESANNLDEVLVTVADTMERRIDRMLTAAVRLVEPLMLMILAVVIGLIAMALVLPISKMGAMAGG